ncbi:hypothetical protein NDU88_001009 [Pleurodeles waltl]|uniref:Uncharacterized protein n=1 Tax=Pleurodeles waltl TaxID=8319 RepID=A0AAV7LY92_PLEWA|nr:hypothetical protein NDU88_001009 [Pleurodeles waltl]
MDRQHFTTDRWTDNTSRLTDGPTTLHDRPMDRQHFTTDPWIDTASRPMDQHCVSLQTSVHNTKVIQSDV